MPIYHSTKGISQAGMTAPRPTHHQAIQGTSLDSAARKPNKVTDHGGECCTVCEAKGIRTPLSRFNSSRDFCFTHTPMEPVSLNAKHRRGNSVVCRHCTQEVPRSDFIARRGRCRACDQRAA